MTIISNHARSIYIYIIYIYCSNHNDIKLLNSNFTVSPIYDCHDQLASPVHCDFSTDHPGQRIIVGVWLSYSHVMLDNWSIHVYCYIQTQAHVNCLINTAINYSRCSRQTYQYWNRPRSSIWHGWQRAMRRSLIGSYSSQQRRQTCSCLKTQQNTATLHSHIIHFIDLHSVFFLIVKSHFMRVAKIYLFLHFRKEIF